MAKQIIQLLFFNLMLTISAFAQISPGDLSSAHSQLDGISNCTQCHDLGKQVSNTKCMDCHKEIKSLISQKRGYHSDYAVQSKNCFDCHSEHHGRKFDMVRFDEKEFDHDLTGYTLESKHLVIDCKDCHKPDYISDPKIQKKETTYIGLEQKCLSCHEDFHQNTLSTDCIACHNFESFRPAPGFNHDDAEFILKGEHLDVDCIECHPTTFQNGNEFQQFTELAFNDCVSCHEDPHLGNIPGNCTQCHAENGFESFMGKQKFDHNKTDFTLIGSHKNVDCFECHKKTNVTSKIFLDKIGINENQCIKCHEDVHKGKFGEACASCHKEQSFSKLKSMEFFDHKLTDYPLEGNHQNVDCINCHKGSHLDPIDFSACKNCHEDYHKGEFSDNGISRDCIECHTVSDGFQMSLFSIENHQETEFPLEGSHLATPCFACHISEETWSFRNIGNDCVDCHEDIHKGFISEKYYPNQKCEQCHNSQTWSDVNFNHELTEWRLDGEHKITECRACHFKFGDDNSTFTQTFFSLSNECIECHKDNHDNQFKINGITDCKRCHDSDNWDANNFDHNLTAFILDGKHANLDCKACHKPINTNGKLIIQYKIKKFECVDCHS